MYAKKKRETFSLCYEAFSHFDIGYFSTKNKILIHLFVCWTDIYLVPVIDNTVLSGTSNLRGGEPNISTNNSYQAGCHSWL